MTKRPLSAKEMEVSEWTLMWALLFWAGAVTVAIGDLNALGTIYQTVAEIWIVGCAAGWGRESGRFRIMRRAGDILVEPYVPVRPRNAVEDSLDYWHNQRAGRLL